ncbi:MAG: PadR family transcriptional regulator [Gemmatimonadetes bacterium]|nr:PadR family transcriptional regulator [Gemmatimonadota bacterium]
MTDRDDRPLTPATFHILLSLAHGPAHGYHIKRMVEERTSGRVRLGAGTLYAGIQRMTKDRLIEETDPPREGDVEPGSRWRFYAISAHGRGVLEREVERLEADLEAARLAMASLPPVRRHA